MKFVNRKTELEELAELERLSKKKLFVTAIYGLRRVGKTRLLLEFLKGRHGLYFFVNKNKTSADLLSEYQQILKESKILGKLEVLDSWEMFFEVLITRHPRPVVFDEFQNFGFVEPAIFGIMQKNVDLNEDKPGLVILSGSTIGLVKKLFMDSKEPLYGRIKKSKKLGPLPLALCFEIGGELELKKEELMKLYLLFGGYPKYYVVVEDFGLQGKTADEIVKALFWAKDAPLEDEVSGILSQEFGGRSGIYYSILEAVASGNNTLSAIAGYLNTTATSITRQISELKDYFELIELEMPYRGKRGIYRLKHPLMEFWFSQIYRNFSEYVARQPAFMKSLEKNMNAVYGRHFERAAKEYLIDKFSLVDAARQWGKIPTAQKGENAYEIDLMGDDGKGTCYAFEFKWKELDYADTLHVLNELEAKTKNVQKIPAGLKLGIVAKKIKEKQNLKSKGYLAFDLDDF